MTSLMTSPGHKVGQILKLIYLRQYLNYSVDQKLKMSEMLISIFLVYSPSGKTSGKKVCRAQNGGHFENFEILNTASIWPQIWKIVPNYAKKSFYMVMTSSMTSGANCKGNVSSINANIIIVFLGYTCQKTISMNNTFRDCRSKVNITGLLGDLGTNNQHCKLSQIQLFFEIVTASIMSRCDFENYQISAQDTL